MILAVNIGNTNARAAIGQRQPVADAAAFWHEIPCGESFLRFLEQAFGPELWERLEGSIISSVVPGKTPLVMDAIQSKTGQAPQRIDLGNCGLSLRRYQSTPGEDRVVCCAGALRAHAPPFILIDFGTATTVNVINQNREFIGGAVMPGFQIGLRALAGNTALLPQIAQVEPHVPVIGGSTRECLTSGALLGTAFAMEGYVRSIQEQLGGKARVLVTGGHAPILLPHCAFDYIHLPNLLLSGLLGLYRPAQ